MRTESEQSERSATFRLSGDVSVKEIRQTHTSLCEAVIAEGDLKIDASEVTSTDTAVLQLLLATRQCSPETEIELSTDPNVIVVLEQLGITALLSTPSNATSGDETSGPAVSGS